jgi:hypothetical protein
MRADPPLRDWAARISAPAARSQSGLPARCASGGSLGAGAGAHQSWP